MQKRKAILILIILFSVFITISNNSQAEENTKRYCVDIEWGSMSFVYDKGSWDTENLEYRKQESSTSPAKGTIDGKPRMVSI